MNRVLKPVPEIFLVHSPASQTPRILPPMSKLTFKGTIFKMNQTQCYLLCIFLGKKHSDENCFCKGFCLAGLQNKHESSKGCPLHKECFSALASVVNNTRAQN
jgi:hypothetical protein